MCCGALGFALAVEKRNPGLHSFTRRVAGCVSVGCALNSRKQINVKFISAPNHISDSLFRYKVIMIRLID